MVLLPKCPYCLVGWAGALGLGGFATHALAIPSVVLVAFCASQTIFFFAMRRVGDKRALAAAAVGVAAILASMWLDLSPVVRWLGVALLVVASTVNALSRARSLARTPAELFRLSLHPRS